MNYHLFTSNCLFTISINSGKWLRVAAKVFRGVEFNAQCSYRVMWHDNRSTAFTQNQGINEMAVLLKRVSESVDSSLEKDSLQDIAV